MLKRLLRGITAILVLLFVWVIKGSEFTESLLILSFAAVCFLFFSALILGSSIVIASMCFKDPYRPTRTEFSRFGYFLLIIISLALYFHIAISEGVFWLAVSSYRISPFIPALVWIVVSYKVLGWGKATAKIK
jgi:hypothetical protein